MVLGNSGGFAKWLSVSDSLARTGRSSLSGHRGAKGQQMSQSDINPGRPLD